MQTMQSPYGGKAGISKTHHNSLIRSHRHRAPIFVPRSNTSPEAPMAKDSMWKQLNHGQELDESFTGLACDNGLFSVVGFGSLLSERSARSTFPDLQNFRIARLLGWRRIFAHACDIFLERGIARLDTKEMSSLSVEPLTESEILVTMFEIQHTQQSIQAFIQREHEFKFVAVQPQTLQGGVDRFGVVCARNTDEEYKAVRCPPEEWQRRYGKHGIDKIWR